MITISLKEFVFTGRFGPVHTGMTMQEVIAILGEPDHISEYQVSTGIRYGWYEFFFDPNRGDELYAMQNDHLMDTPLYQQCIDLENKRFRIDAWFLQRGENITRTATEALLIAEHIPYHKEILMGAEILKLGSGVSFDFDFAHDTDEEEVLNGIRYFPG